MTNIPLKRKYLTIQCENHKIASRTSKSTKKKGLAALMTNAKAIDLHYVNCAINGWFEQIPLGKHALYKARAKAYTSCAARDVVL